MTATDNHLTSNHRLTIELQTQDYYIDPSFHGTNCTQTSLLSRKSKNLSTMTPINVGIIGYGTSAKIYNLPFIVPNPDLNVYAFLQRAAAPDPTTAKAGSHCTLDFLKAKHYRTADDFFSDPQINLVIVCTGPETHASFAERALRVGKDGSLSPVPSHCQSH